MSGGELIGLAFFGLFWLAFGFIGLLLLLRTERCVAGYAIAISRLRPFGAAVGWAATLPPYRWLLGGRSWSASILAMRDQPESFPRMIAAGRVLGAIFAVGLPIGVVALAAVIASFIT